MRSSDDPFDARPTPEVLATDALLDRVGARAPTPDDLDDPLVAALALMAAEIDLDAVPVETTRAALARAVPDLDVPPATRQARPPLHDEERRVARRARTRHRRQRRPRRAGHRDLPRRRRHRPLRPPRRGTGRAVRKALTR